MYEYLRKVQYASDIRFSIIEEPSLLSRWFRTRRTCIAYEAFEDGANT